MDLQIRRGETLGIVGESGCGKSTLAQLLMGMLKPNGDNISRIHRRPRCKWCFRIRSLRWIASACLADYHRTGLDQKRSSERERRMLAAALASQVGIRPEYLDRLPHAFSGGQRQRIAIARALSSEPDVIVLDEPTSALDISVQAQILNLLVALQTNRNLTYILISHNVSVVRHMSDRVAVMYLGQIVELGDTAQVLTTPAHPYTRLLLDSVPKTGAPLAEELMIRKRSCPVIGFCRWGVSFANGVHSPAADVRTGRRCADLKPEPTYAAGAPEGR